MIIGSLAHGIKHFFETGLREKEIDRNLLDREETRELEETVTRRRQGLKEDDRKLGA
jgi:hypothetical protein